MLFVCFPCIDSFALRLQDAERRDSIPEEVEIQIKPYLENLPNTPNSGNSVNAVNEETNTSENGKTHTGHQNET